MEWNGRADQIKTRCMLTFGAGPCSYVDLASLAFNGGAGHDIEGATITDVASKCRLAVRVTTAELHGTSSPSMRVLAVPSLSTSKGPSHSIKPSHQTSISWTRAMGG